jgi:methionine aminopeptidase
MAYPDSGVSKMGISSASTVGDSALTVGVGSINTEAQKLIDVTRESLFAGIAKMVPGNRTGDISAAIQQHVLGVACMRIHRSRITASRGEAFR